MSLREEGGNSRVLLDGREIVVPDHVKTVQDVIVYVQAKVIPTTRVLTDIIVDGRYLSADEEQQSYKLILRDIALLELRTRKTLEVAIDALYEANDLLRSLKRDLISSATSLTNNSISAGLETFHNAMHSIDSYLTLMGTIEASIITERPWLRIRGKEHGLPDDTRQHYVSFADPESLKKKFALIEKAHKDQDFPQLTKIINNELVPLVEDWATELPEIIDKMRAEQHEA